MQQIDDLFEIVTCVELYLINMNCKLWIIYIYIYKWTSEYNGISSKKIIQYRSYISYRYILRFV